YPLRRLQNHLDGSAAEFSNYLRRQGKGFAFVNYAASNTGFTLWDSYSYGEKHNEENGEDNCDGSNYNCSHNFGYEGQTANRIINRNRMTAVRTALCCVMVAQGIPMILAGDEVANTQSGNNNPYCQDNEIGWVTYSRRKLPKLLREYIRQLISFRKAHTILSNPQPMHMNDYKHTGMPDLSYHGRLPWIMGIGEEKKALGILYNAAYARGEEEEDVMVCFNFYYGEESFALPRPRSGRSWYFVTNTGQELWKPENKPLADQSFVAVPGGTITILVGRK
ncbi:MAG: glycogen operon protein GlgX, partial [Lachnospiraceae bacterium]|nr:glycogen operon protein GlgX [Lachnospiraceae bacterium]